MNVVFSEAEMKKFLEEATRVSQVVLHFLLVTLMFLLIATYLICSFSFHRMLLEWFFFFLLHASLLHVGLRKLKAFIYI